MQLNVKTMYPLNPDYDYNTRLERINIDDERINDLRKGKGFIVTEPTSIKKDVKDYNGIFSTRFGQTLQDVNPFANRYSCPCKHLQGRVYSGQKCPLCGEPVKYVGDEMDFFGYITLEDPYYIIHPNLYKSLEFVIGAKYLRNILKIEDKKNEDGFSIEAEKPKNEPFFGIGMMAFKERWEEVLNHYIQSSPNKIEYYKDIMGEASKLFIQSIPVYTTHLRPFRIEGENFYFEGANAIYNAMAKFAGQINQKSLKMMRRTNKPKDTLLWDLQEKYNSLYSEIEETLARKKGRIRSSYGGRYNFTTRAVIVSDPSLGVDQIRLPYHALVEMCQQRIINILHKSYGMSYSDAYKKWWKGQAKRDQIIYDIIKGIIDSEEGGLACFVDRPPTIQYGSILFMYCIGINDDYTMSVPLQPLPLWAGDFDGDTLTILWIINKAVREKAAEVFSPANAMFISRNDGMFDNQMNHQRDVIIVACGLSNICREFYTEEEIDAIKKAQSTPVIY